MAIQLTALIPSSSPEELEKVLRSLAMKWGDVVDDLESLQVKPLKGAMTNEIFMLDWPTKHGEKDRRKVLVRVYGEGVELLFDRQKEIQTFESVSRQGQGPKLLGRFADGRVEEFINARTLSAHDLRDPEISSLIASKIREFHALDIAGPKNVLLWHRLRTWLAEAKCLCSQEDAKSFRLDEIGHEIDLLEENIRDDENQEIGFCHNDLQYGNIMIDEETTTITIIDYEYASYNPIVYDIANHFCEMAANYHSKTPHVLNYNLYPGQEERERFIHTYLSALGEKPRKEEVARLVNDAEKYILPNHLFWGLWGLISGYVNKIEFDYITYARQRFEQYWLRRAKILEPDSYEQS